MTDRRRNMPREILSLVMDWGDLKKLQKRGIDVGSWLDIDDTELFNFERYQYRVKPEPKTVYVVSKVLAGGRIFLSREDAELYACGCKVRKFVEVLED